MYNKAKSPKEDPNDPTSLEIDDDKLKFGFDMDLSLAKFMSFGTRIDRVMPQGCVFGVRDGAGSWSFYLQKTVTFSFTRLRKKKGFLSSSYVPANASLPPSQVKAILESYL